MGTKHPVWICWSVLCATLVAAEPEPSAVLAKLRAERIAPITLTEVGPREVVALLHERLAEHAQREGYQLVWEVPEDLPDTPKVLFGVENGTLALLMEAATRLANLATTATDQKLTVHARGLDEALRETRRYPVRDEFWQSLKPRSPETFFGELGIDFPKGTAAHLSRDRHELTVTHNPEILALVEEVLRVTFAYPCHWQLRLSIVDSAGQETPFAKLLVLDPKETSRLSQDAGGHGDRVEVSAKAVEWYRDEQILRFALGIRVIRGGNLVRREDTTLVLANGIGTVLDLGEGRRLRVVPEFRAADGSPYPVSSGNQVPAAVVSEETRCLLDTVLPTVRAEDELFTSFVQRLTTRLLELDPNSRGIGVAYLLQRDPNPSQAPSRMGEPESLKGGMGPGWMNDTFPPVVNLNMDAVPVGEVFRYLATVGGLAEETVRSGVLLLPRSMATGPLERWVIGPGESADGLMEVRLSPTPPPGRAGTKETTQRPAAEPSVEDPLQVLLQACGVGFPVGARIDHATYGESCIVVSTNTKGNARKMQVLMQTLDGWWFYDRLWHTEAQLVRLPAGASGNGTTGEVLAHAGSIVFEVQSAASNGETTVCQLPHPARGGDGVVLTTCAISDPSRRDKAEIRLEISGRGGKRSWHSSLNVQRNEGKSPQTWQVFRADSLDAGRSAGEQSFLLVSHFAQPLWRDSNEPTEAQPETATTETEKPQGKSPFWDLLFMLGLAEAGEQVTWETYYGFYSQDPWNQRGRHNGDRVRMWMEQGERQCRLRLSSEGQNAEVAECAFGFGKEANLPVPGRPGKSIQVTAAETIRGERIALRWRIGWDWAGERELLVGETIQLIPGLSVRAEVVGGWYMEPLEPSFATAVREEEEYRSSLLGQHRAVLDRWGDTRFADVRLHDAPLAVALARIGELGHAQVPGIPPAWRIDQPILFGKVPEGAEAVHWPRNRPEAERGGDLGDLSDSTELQEDMGSDDDDETWNDNERRRKISIPPERHRGPARLTGYRLPVPGKRASFDLHNVTLGQLLAALEQAYGVPLYLREQDDEMLVRAAPLFHTARFGVPTAELEPNTQAEFRAWLQERGVLLTATDHAVLFRSLDTVVARGSAPFIQRLGQILNPR